MTTDFVPIISAWPRLGIVQSAVRAGLIEVTALVRGNWRRDRTYEPDPWSHEAPFINPEWPRS